MFDTIESTLETMRGKFLGPRVIHFSNGTRLEADIRKDEPTLMLRDANKNELVDLRKFALPDTKLLFSANEKWRANIYDDGRPSEIFFGKFKKAGAILDFLHECGHLHDIETVKTASTAQNNYITHFFNDATDISPERLHALKERREKTIASERNAWAYSLRKTRELEREYGINIIEQMGGKDAVFAYINHSLENHEAFELGELEHMGIELFSPKQFEETLHKLALAS